MERWKTVFFSVKSPTSHEPYPEILFYFFLRAKKKYFGVKYFFSTTDDTKIHKIFCEFLSLHRRFWSISEKKVYFELSLHRPNDDKLSWKLWKSTVSCTRLTRKIAFEPTSVVRKTIESWLVETASYDAIYGNSLFVVAHNLRHKSYGASYRSTTNNSVTR